MTSRLIITNGDAAVDVMKRAGLADHFLPWRDVLYEGPVLAGLDLTSLSTLRARFISDRGWGEPERVLHSFRERDRELERAGNYPRITLWFEHDLYDQLQILQVLDWFCHHRPDPAALSMVCTKNYLGPSSPDEISALMAHEEEVTTDQLELAHHAWSAFTAPDPIPWTSLLDEETSLLPFLRGAVLRLLEEYPHSGRGLSRTALAILRLIEQESLPPGRLFARYMESEEHRFLGDASFWFILNSLAGSVTPLIHTQPEPLTLPASSHQTVVITNEGRECLTGNRNSLDTHPIDQWIGGVHLTPDNRWWWDPDTQTVRKEEA
mgnify:FL=1